MTSCEALVEHMARYILDLFCRHAPIRLQHFSREDKLAT